MAMGRNFNPPLESFGVDRKVQNPQKGPKKLGPLA